MRAGDAGASAVSFELPSRFSATVTIGADGLVRRVDSIVPDPVLGDTPVVTTYDDYRESGGIRFPTRVRQTIAGYGVLDLAVKDVQVNPPLALAVPDAARNVAERVTSEKVAEGVWFLAGGSHNSVLIELQDQLVLVETPLNDARTRAVIEHAKALVPGQADPHRGQQPPAFRPFRRRSRRGGRRGDDRHPRRQRGVLREGVRASRTGSCPTRWRARARRPTFRTFTDKLEIGDASRPIEVHRIVGGPHSESIAMVYLPQEKLLIEADAFTPPAPNTPPPAVVNANNANLVDNIERLKLVGRSHPAAARPGRAGRRPVRGDAANAAALTLSRERARSRKSCSRSA